MGKNKKLLVQFQQREGDKKRTADATAITGNKKRTAETSAVNTNKKGKHDITMQVATFIYNN